MKTWLFWILWTIDALVAGIFLYFFAYGVLIDHTVSSFNIVLWLGILAALAAILGGSLLLRAKSHFIAAILVTALLAIPAVLAGLFVLMLLITQPRWN